MTVGAFAACSSVDTQTTTTTSSSGTGSGGAGGEQAASSSVSSTAAATTAASTSAASSSSSGGGVMCGASTCVDADIAGFITLPGCCPPNAQPDKCGLDTSALAAFIGVSLGCVELNQAGDPDANCPSRNISAQGQMVTLPGCCRPDMVCGNVVDLSSMLPGAPNFGCADGALFTDAGAPPACGGSSGSSSSSGTGGADAGP